ncbi:sulfite exporter TauE/SafE family protein [Paenibacillus sp. BSR1-1]|uniref:sulfite exporter TauE/SafE family protein n=1 Tax=Paenibacillus sp. BSR1-1 TaxID=3020845 RepID=UPI0025AFAD66|nr:sulfite exporter TauE/SafE family protein [Paenibacillus sp. BSR1-1]MDN3016116.1 sulfite exporter TauE/SafE family protein [Paenibacillus sp. BSR1-1]
MSDYLFLISLVIGLNMIVGILLGMSGISGFLLPLIYVGFFKMPVHDSLALSFLSFAVSGTIGTISYWKSKNMNFKLALYLSIGSLPGAFLGVQINVLISDYLSKLLLYIFVLLAGLSILLKRTKDPAMEKSQTKMLDHSLLAILLGFITAVICALTGAGGPILLVPVLAGLGLNIRTAVGVSLLNSIVIAIPSILGYFSHASMGNSYMLIIGSLLGTIAGIVMGVRLANKVPIPQLKMMIAIITILSSLYMLVMLNIRA